MKIILVIAALTVASWYLFFEALKPMGNMAGLGRQLEQPGNVNVAYDPANNRTDPILPRSKAPFRRNIGEVTSRLCRVGYPYLADRPYGAEPPYAATVVEVLDGDTLVVTRETSDEITIRLWGIDAPEMGQAESGFARTFLAREIVALAKRVTVYPMGQDRYGRTVAIVGAHGRLSLNAVQVRRGYAFVYAEYAGADVCLASSEYQARNEKRGVWQERHKEELRPWDYRKQYEG